MNALIKEAVMSGLGATTTSEELAVTARRTWWVTVLRGVLAVMLGIVALLAPISTAVALAIFIGAYAIVDGVTEIVASVRQGRSRPMGLRIVLGVVNVLFGITVLLWPGLSLVVLGVMVGAWTIIVGVVEIIASVGSRARQDRSWVWGSVVGALWVLLGVVVLFRPGAGVVALVWTVALGALVVGVALIVAGVSERKLGSSPSASPVSV